MMITRARLKGREILESGMPSLPGNGHIYAINSIMAAETGTPCNSVMVVVTMCAPPNQHMILLLFTLQCCKKQGVSVYHNCRLSFSQAAVFHNVQ